ncbi:MAG TPA: NUDIX domain-containing protein [Pirellulales bacterium]|nr:NUDIX domain-containing protein [Pirellulales bacterium]
MSEKALRRGVVAVITRDEALLVIRRAEGIAAPGKYCFPGGGIEEAESEELALVRELREELGATVEPQRRLWQSVTPWGVELAWWLADLDHTAPLVPNPAEVASVHWLTMAEMDSLEELLESNREFLRHIRAGAINLR